MSKVEQSSKAILETLLADFSANNLTANDLSEGYVGTPIAQLRQKCCGETAASPVDFNLALKALDEGGLIQTGPTVPFENDRDSGFFVIGVYSKYEFAYLTEKGYRAAQKSQAAPRLKPSRTEVNISGGHFLHSPIGVGDHIVQSASVSVSSNAPIFVDLRKAVEDSGIEISARTQLLAGIEEMQRTHNTPGFIDRYKDFIASAANHMAIVGPFLPALSSLLGGPHF